MMLEDRRNIRGKYKDGSGPLPIIGTNESSRSLDIVEQVSLLSGNKTLYLSYSPIMSIGGDSIGTKGDSSLSFSSLLTTEIEWKEDFRSENTLSAGEFSVHYESGIVKYNSSSTTSVAASYKFKNTGQPNLILRLDDTTTANVIYIGKSFFTTLTSVAKWQIFKIDETTGLVLTWADGNDLFDNIWDNRAGLSYS